MIPINNKPVAANVGPQLGWFFTDDLTGKEGKTGKDLTVVPAFYPGAFGRYTTFDMFAWVVEKGYEREEPFQKYHAARLMKLREMGQLN